MIKSIIQEIRVKHWIKNALIFLPLFFGNQLNSPSLLFRSFIGVLSFCFMSSAIYIFNDIHDLDKDRQHPTKCKRPIAAGRLSVPFSVCLAVVLLVVSYLLIVASISQGRLLSLVVLSVYLLDNVLYSIFGFKNFALVDVCLLALGFWLRLMMGSAITGIPISDWLHLVIITGSLFMGLGKRRGELLSVGKETRTVLKKYTVTFLDRAMYSCLTLALTFFALWCKEQDRGPFGISFIVCVPLLILLCFRYAMIIESGDVDGDPVNVILGDKFCIIVGILFVLLMAFLMYL